MMNTRWNGAVIRMNLGHISYGVCAAALAAVAVGAVFLASGDAARAEGRCPPGYYPVGGDRASDCAPIPGAQNGAEMATTASRHRDLVGRIPTAPSSGGSGETVPPATTSQQAPCPSDKPMPAHSVSARARAIATAASAWIFRTATTPLPLPGRTKARWTPARRNGSPGRRPRPPARESTIAVARSSKPARAFPGRGAAA